IHVSGISMNGKHAPIPPLFPDTENSSISTFLSTCFRVGIRRLIVEHEINPNSLNDAEESRNALRTY
ncbi:hypothetical protein ACI3PL_30235, partial [Lacticaseibacillus paracasei]